MFPGFYEFHWEAGRIIFLGAFYAVILTILWTLALAARRTREDLRRKRAEAIRWEEDFENLPADSRLCRHCFSGEFDFRICPNGFDCRRCSTHRRLLAGRPPVLPEARDDGGDIVQGFQVRPDRLYHRGHTWVHFEDDGTVTIGLDDLAGRLMGRPEAMSLPAPGTRLETNGIAWRMSRGGSEVRILSPLDGVVVDRGGHAAGWYLRVRPQDGDPDTGHLLRGAEVAPWLVYEFERLGAGVANERPGASMRDGGAPVDDLLADIPEPARDGVLGEAFLDL